jgi:hypothetical protein
MMDWHVVSSLVCLQMHLRQGVLQLALRLRTGGCVLGECWAIQQQALCRALARPSLALPLLSGALSRYNGVQDPTL